MIGAVYRAELRANRIALVALPVLSMAMYGGIRYLRHLHTSNAYSYQSILDDAFVGGVFLAMAITALGLGVLHIARDTGQGAWAFLMHRPATPGQILLGKLASALTIYFAVTAPPLLAAIFWAATPGHLPGPWEWGMALPSLVDLLGATLYIVTGMLIVLRNARWFGTRLFPLLVPLCCTIAMWDSRFVTAICALLIGWFILLAVTWSAMATRDRPSIQRWPARLLTSIALVPASILVPVIFAAIIAEYIRPATSFFPHQLTLRDGQLLDSTYDAQQWTARIIVNRQDQVLTDAPVLPLKLTEQRMQSTMLYQDHNAWSPRAQAPNYRRFGHYYAADFGSASDGLRSWYYQFSKRYFVCYLKPIRGEAFITGYIGQNGSVTNKARVEPFAQGSRLNSSTGTFVIEPQRVYLPTSIAPPSGPIFTSPAGETCRDASYLPAYGAKPEDARLNYVIITDKALYLVDAQRIPFARMPHPSNKPVVTVAITPDPDVYMALYQNENASYIGGASVFVRFRADGTKLAQIEIPELQPPLKKTFGNSDLLMMALFPPFGPLIDAHLPPGRGLLVLATQSVIAALGALMILRRARASVISKILWVIIALLGGVSGLILMAGTRSWPLLVRCPACGKPRRASVLQCDHCGANFPIPDPGPIGIFDTTREPAHA